MFEHVEPFGGDPILSLNEDFQRDPCRDDHPDRNQPGAGHLQDLSERWAASVFWNAL